MQWRSSQACRYGACMSVATWWLHHNPGLGKRRLDVGFVVDGNVDSGSQQQWISRNCDWKSWTGANWNMVFVGVLYPPEGAWPSPPYTKVAQDAVVREKPFLQMNAAGEFSVRVPELHSDSVGITWRSGETAEGRFDCAVLYSRPDVDTAETISASFPRKNLILTPASITEPLRFA